MSGSKLGSREAFLEVYEKLRDELVSELLPEYGLPQEAADWNREVIEYNVPGGKLNRGLTVVHVLQSIRGAAVSEEEGFKASVLGWAIEWLQAFFLVADDIMDGSITRRGQPCWYKVPKVGLVGINDGFLLQSHMYKMLQKHFKGSPHYLHLLELFTEVTWQTELGQLMDLTTQPQPGAGEINLDRFTMERYKAIVKYKTAYYSFYLPVACGLILAGLATEEVLKKAEGILLIMGEYFQIQDDYLDCFAPPEVIGKIGTDIQDNKCSWLVVTALAKATPEQRAFLKTHYGKHDDASVAAVKQLYNELGIEAEYKAYEQASYEELTKRIKDICADGSVPEAVFQGLLDKIYKRSK